MVNGLAGLDVLNHEYEIIYTSKDGQQKTARGNLKSTDQDGFVVVERNGKYVLIPKDRVEEIKQVD